MLRPGVRSRGSRHACIILGTTPHNGLIVDRPVFEPFELGLLFTLPDHLWLRVMVNLAGTSNLDWALQTFLQRRRGAIVIRKSGADGELPTCWRGRPRLPPLPQRSWSYRTRGCTRRSCPVFRFALRSSHRKGMSSARREPHRWLLSRLVGGSRREKLLGGQIMFADNSIQMYGSRRLMRMLSRDTGLCAHRLWRRPRGANFPWIGVPLESRPGAFGRGRRPGTPDRCLKVGRDS